MNTLIKGQNFLIFPDLSLSEMIFIPAGVKPFEGAEPLLPFWIGKYPVTQILWHRVIPNYNPSRFKGGKRPVENVPLKMIVEQFLPTLNSKQKHGQGLYRLPTQSEWSYAAGPGCEDKVEENIYPSAWTYDCSHLESKPVGLKLANKFGLYDVYGNVSEWCVTTQKEQHYVNEHINKPKIVENQVLGRGGNWGSFVNGYSNRSYHLELSSSGSMFMGFRLVYQ